MVNYHVTIVPDRLKEVTGAQSSFFYTAGFFVLLVTLHQCGKKTKLSCLKVCADVILHAPHFNKVLSFGFK